MLPRHVCQGLVFAAGLCLFGSPALAQRRGPMNVLGLRAPDGDDEAAAEVTNAVRILAQRSGYALAEGSPTLEVEMAAFNGCDATLGPECMSQIATSLHVPHLIYGSVQRLGRGRNAAVNIELNLWDQDNRRIVHHESRTMPGAQARDANAVREVARQLFEGIILGEPEVYVPPSERATQTAQAALPQTVVVRVSVPTTQRSHILRYLGFGAVGLGAVAGIVGVVEWVLSNSQASNAANADPRGNDDYAAWARYDNLVNANRGLSVSDVCARAGTDALEPSAIGARNVCSSNATSRALALGMGIGGAVVAVAGAVLIVLDRGGNSAEQAPQATGARAALERIQVSPMAGPHVGGMNLGLTF